MTGAKRVPYLAATVLVNVTTVQAVAVHTEALCRAKAIPLDSYGGSGHLIC
jgi:hypothetical protein